MTIRAASVIRACASALVLLCATPVAGAAEPFERFFGWFEGNAIVDGDATATARDLTVKIGPWEEGFVVAWSTLIPKAGGKVKRASYEVRFKATRRDNIYASAMRRNMFGHAQPLDPLKGEPYVWARIEGDVMTVYTMLVTDEGGYEMQMHRRELREAGMALSFSRVRDGEVLREVTGTLKRLE
jgi:hypothetical protein